MDDQIKFEVEKESLRRTVAILDALGKGIYNDPTIKQGLRKAGDYLIEKGKQRLAARSSTVTKAFKKTLKKKNYGVLSGFDRYKATVGNIPGHMVFLPAIIDKGTENRYTRRGYNRGQVKGNGFWTETREQDSETAMKIVLDAVQSGIDKLMNR